MISGVGFWYGGNPEAHAVPKPGAMHFRHVAHLLPCDEVGNSGTSADYQLIIAQYFPRNRQVVGRLRRRFPNARIALRLDRAVEHVLQVSRHNTFALMLDEYRAADLIACHMTDMRHAAFLSQVTGTPAFPLPTPIVPHPDIAALRSREREDLVVALDHRAPPRYPAPTMACLTALQRATGCRVVIAKPVDDYSKQLAQAFGLRVRWVHPGHEALLEWLSRARVVVDLYTMHTPGRINALAAYVGTPSVGSWNSAHVGHPQVDPWSDKGLQVARDVWNNERAWAVVRDNGIECVERHHSPDALRRYVEAML